MIARDCPWNPPRLAQLLNLVDLKWRRGWDSKLQADFESITYGDPVANTTASAEVPVAHCPPLPAEAVLTVGWTGAREPAGSPPLVG